MNYLQKYQKGKKVNFVEQSEEDKRRVRMENYDREKKKDTDKQDVNLFNRPQQPSDATNVNKPLHDFSYLTKYSPETLRIREAARVSNINNGEIKQGKGKQSNDTRTQEQRNKDYFHPIKGAAERWRTSMETERNPLVGINRTFVPAIEAGAMLAGGSALYAPMKLLRLRGSTKFIGPAVQYVAKGMSNIQNVKNIGTALTIGDASRFAEKPDVTNAGQALSSLIPISRYWNTFAKPAQKFANDVMTVNDIMTNENNK